jgi:hypothetical protein
MLDLSTCGPPCALTQTAARDTHRIARAKLRIFMAAKCYHPTALPGEEL